MNDLCRLIPGEAPIYEQAPNSKDDAIRNDEVDVDQDGNKQPPP